VLGRRAPFALQLRFEGGGFAAGFGDAVAPGVGGGEVAVEGALGAGGGAGDAGEVELADREAVVGLAERAQFGDVLFVADADRQAAAQVLELGDEVVEVGSAGGGGGVGFGAGDGVAVRGVDRLRGARFGRGGGLAAAAGEGEGERKRGGEQRRQPVPAAECATKRAMARPMRSLAGAALAVALALLALAPGARAMEGDGGVLVVGDSLEELTSPHLEGLLPGVPLTIDAVGGSNSYQIYDLFQESYSPSDSVIVFDAGTNDNPAYPEILAENLAKVAATVGDRCMVVPTIHGYTVEGHNNRGKNGVVHKFAASRPGTQTPDWATTVNQNPSLLEPDNLHPNPEGSEVRAQLIAEGITACLAGSPTGLTGIPGGGESLETAASSTAATAAPRPETEHLPLVDRVAERRRQLIARLAGGFARGAAAYAALSQLLPAG
jgi:hypothetical protein